MATLDRHPTKHFDQIIQTGLKALELANQHKAELEARLPAGTIDGLAADLDALGAELPATLTKRAVARTATHAQNDALAEAYALVLAIRANVQRCKTTPAVRHAYGVGGKVRANVVKQVKAAIEQIVDRARANPGEAAGLGILPSDVSELEADLTRITSVDAEQEQLRAAAPLTTRQRNQTANRILAAIDRIAGAGMLHFAKSPTEATHFEALVKSTRAKAGTRTGAKKAEVPAGG
jgi:hypothetical protein